MHAAAPEPEDRGDRALAHAHGRHPPGGVRCRHRDGQSRRLPQPGHLGIPHRRRQPEHDRLLRGQCSHPGRAHRHRGSHRRRPRGRAVADRRRRPPRGCGVGPARRALAARVRHPMPRQHRDDAARRHLAPKRRCAHRLRAPHRSRATHRHLRLRGIRHQPQLRLAARQGDRLQPQPRVRRCGPSGTPGLRRIPHRRRGDEPGIPRRTARPARSGQQRAHHQLRGRSRRSALLRCCPSSIGLGARRAGSSRRCRRACWCNGRKRSAGRAAPRRHRRRPCRPGRI